MTVSQVKGRDFKLLYRSRNGFTEFDIKALPRVTYDALPNRIYYVINTFVRMKTFEIEEVSKPNTTLMRCVVRKE